MGVLLVDVPSPKETGASGKQKAVSDDISVVRSSGSLIGLPMADTVTGLASTNSRSLGGEVAASLLAGSFSQMSHDLQDAKKKINQLSEDLKSSEKEKYDWKERSSVLRERLNSASHVRNLGNLSITLGTALVGVAIELYRNQIKSVAYLCAAIGGGLMLLGWLSGHGGEK